MHNFVRFVLESVQVLTVEFNALVFGVEFGSQRTGIEEEIHNYFETIAAQEIRKKTVCDNKKRKRELPKALAKVGRGERASTHLQKSFTYFNRRSLEKTNDKYKY